MTCASKDHAIIAFTLNQEKPKTCSCGFLSPQMDLVSSSQFKISKLQMSLSYREIA